MKIVDGILEYSMLGLRLCTPRFNGVREVMHLCYLAVIEGWMERMNEEA